MVSCLAIEGVVRDHVAVFRNANHCKDHAAILSFYANPTKDLECTFEHR